ncbi:metallophosphoesterase [Kaistella jeonii]|uniref:Metallophosphoesterase n=1 Tax=Kaistella jeonii TaxID=266749 RepID=A0A0C1FJU9_9FLAO|nr:metallophosphoesterase [Kaistella jeonii]KIA88199.1 metallophosphoesterase [Kaistella jeonii]SFC25668.1 Surface antigen [Kaistella jeonii]VEI95662.1 Surface antigen [Kaistella jeonii]
MNFKPNFVKYYAIIYCLAFVFSLNSCATYDLKKGKSLQISSTKTELTNEDYRVFLVGDVGNADDPQAQKTLDLLHTKLDSADKNSILIFLGDNIYPLGMPAEDSKSYPLAKEKLENQLKITKNFKGKTLFIPGNHDWYHGLEGLKAQEKFVENYMKDKDAFLPNNGCPIEDINLSDDIKLIAIDTEWYLINWNNHPEINKKCRIKSREDFWTEVEDLIKKNQNKTIIIAQHHPIISTGTHAGYTSLKDNIYPFRSKIPLPIITFGLNILRTASGASIEDLNNLHYSEYTNRMKNLIQNNDNIIVVSGHDHNLQYHEQDDIRQIVSGAGSKSDPATIAKHTDLSFGNSGFVVMDILKSEKITAEYFSTTNANLKSLANIEVRSEKSENTNTNYFNQFPKTIKSSIYPKKMTEKGFVYRFLLGDHYRKEYGIQIEVPVVDLQNLKGGLKPIRAGGGHQSNSLRLINPNGQEFAMRAMKKSAVRFLNTVAFKNSTVGNQFDQTYAEDFLLDFYTTSQPYAPFAIGNLAEKLYIYHNDPKLYYVPKQPILGKYNTDYGNELYMIEERFSDDPVTLKKYNADDIASTDDVLKNLRTSPKYEVDEKTWIRVRLFDMLIGDWDRHEDQWKWLERKKDGKVIYEPIPRDRDQAFSKYDGLLFRLIMSDPALRHMQTFKEKIQNVKWFNREAYPIDLIFTKNSNLQDWLKEADFIIENLSDQDIESAFNNLPKEVNDSSIDKIKSILKIRKTQLKDYAKIYFNVLQKKIVLTGTEKIDDFKIIKKERKIEISQYFTDKNGDEKLVFQNTYDERNTREIWIYGLNEDDIFDVQGSGKSKITIRLIGGQNNDVYKVEDGKRVKIYDFKSSNNTYKADRKTQRNISDNYEINTYDYKKPKYNYFTQYGNFGYHPDFGVKVGVTFDYTVNNFILNPYTEKHKLKINYYTETEGFDVIYNGIFKKAIGNFDFNIDALYTTPFFTQNFFGLSNKSSYDKEIREESYNRVRIEQLHFSPSISETGWLNFTNLFTLKFEHNKVDRTPNRFVSEPLNINLNAFSTQKFASMRYRLSYENYNSKSFPTLGMNMILESEWKTNLEETRKNYFMLFGQLDVIHRITNNEKLVFANGTKMQWINNNNFEFYQASTIGGSNDLRAYRAERFSGKSSFSNSSDVRLNLGQLKNPILPINYGIFGGYDVGRVWNNGEFSKKWHQSVGGGLWLSLAESITGKINFFYGSDGTLFSFNFGLNF